MRKTSTYFFPEMYALCRQAKTAVKNAYLMRLALVVSLFVSLVSYGQNTSFFQAQFNGGVTACGYGPEYDLGGTGVFTLNIAPGSTIYKAWLFAGRQGVAPSLTLTLNGTSLTFDNTNQVSTTFQSAFYGGNSAVHAIDVSSVVSVGTNTYTMVLPNQPGGPSDRFQDFYLYVAYANSSMPLMTTCIFLNSADCQQTINDVFNFTYPIQNIQNVGMELFFGYACDLSDGETVVVDGTTTGTVYGPNSNSGYCAGPFGDFYYQNGTLYGLADGVPDEATNGPDAISNIQTIVDNCADSVVASFSGGAQSNALWGFFFTYAAIPISINTDTAVCSGSPVQLNINTGGGTVSWSPTVGLSCTSCSNPIATITTNTQYIATISGSGCSPVIYDTATITMSAGSASVHVDDTTICGGNSATLTATPVVGGGTYLWAPGGATSQSITVSPATTSHYTVTYTSATCGSASDTATVTIGGATTSAQSQSICSGSSYTFGGQVLTTAGTYRDTIVNASGCDSIIVLTLSIVSTLTTPVSQSICNGGSYNFNGQTLTTSGTYRDTLISAGGCDSIVVLTLSIGTTSASAFSQSICNGSSYSFNGQTLTTAGTYHDTLTNVSGCDSIVTLTLTTGAVQTTNISRAICFGTSTIFDGQTITTAGSYSDTLTSVSGCDSIVVLTVTVLTTSSSAVSASICPGSSYTFDGQSLTTAGTYMDTLIGVNGCDSIVTLTLTGLANSSSAISQTICSNSGILFNGQTISTAGTYQETLTNAAGCDSIVTLTLTVVPASSSAISQTICNGTGYSFNGQTLTVTGTYLDTLTNAAGCDSIVTLTLTVLSTSSTAISASICSGSSYTFNGQTLSTAGTYIDTLTNAAGCDSIVTLTVTVLATSATPISQTICSNSSYTFNGQTLNTTGTYIDTLTNVAGCDSIVALVLTVIPVSTLNLNPAICSGRTYDFNGQILTTAGTYIDTFMNAGGCDSIVTVDLTILPQPTAKFIIEPANTAYTLGSVVSLTSQSTNTDSVLWQLNNEAVSLLSGGLLPPFTDTGTYCIRLVASTSAGCADTSMECITVYNNAYYMPNAFTPNGDGVNDYISLYGERNAMKYIHISIFDRWGERVFESTDLNFQWDGKYRGQMEEPGIYVYQLDITFISGSSIKNKGSISLIR